MKLKYQRIIAFVLVYCFLVTLFVPNTIAAAPTAPTISATYNVDNGEAIISYVVESKAKVKKVLYVNKEVTDVNSEEFLTNGIAVTNSNTFSVTEEGTYSLLVEDMNGSKGLCNVKITMELRAIWISYLEFSSSGYTKEAFYKHVDKMFDNVVSLNMNAVIVQVRPFGDAFYPSKYFPWSKYISGEQGKDPGFDPLAYMVEAAHERGLEFHAWLNPYRVTLNNTDVTTLAKKNLARTYLTDKATYNDRYVLSFNNNLYYNPSIQAVQGLIVKGVKEIIQTYDVDGIHFDDYFYPALGSKYDKIFDAKEYQTYKSNCIKKGTSYLSIADWRRENVNTLVSNVYKMIKRVDPNIEFGISPAGYYDKLMMDDRYYVDVKTWLSSEGYIDYICPQIYWSFSHNTYPFDETLDEWLKLRTNTSIKIYAGIAVYKAGIDSDIEFLKDKSILANMIEAGRNTESVSGYMFFRYGFFFNKSTKYAVNSLLKVLKK